MDKWATVLRYGLTYVLAPLAARKGLDAVATGNLIDAALASVLSLLTLSPMLWNLFTRPSSAAMEVAVQADKVLSGEKPRATVATPRDKPDLVVAPAPATRGGQG